MTVREVVPSADTQARLVSPSGPAPRRWQVLVLANSVATMVMPRRDSRQDGTYPEVLEWLLRDAGHDVSVRNSSRPFDQVKQGLQRFMEVERAQFHDVMVVQFGGAEFRQAVIPYALLKHLHQWDKGERWAARAYRTHVVPHLWKAVRAYQCFMCTRIGLHTWRMSPARFEREMRRLISFARQDRMLVLVADGNPPGQRVLGFMPGLDRRWAVFQKCVADVVAGFHDDDVRLVPMSTVAEEMGIDAALPDALHFSAEAHRRVAAMLADQIIPWIDTQQTATGPRR